MRRRGLDIVVVRPKTFLGPERLGVFEIFFCWIRGMANPHPRRRVEHYQLLAAEDLVEAVVLASAAPGAAGRTIIVGAAVSGTVREDLRR